MNYPFANQPLILSDSTAGAFNSCERKFEFRKLYRHPGGSHDLAQEVGHCLHIGAQSYAVNNNREKAIFDMLMAYPYHLNTDPENDRSAEACFAILNKIMDSGYLHKFSIASIKLKDGSVKKAIEVPFRIRFTNIDFFGQPVYWIGFIDIIFFHHGTGEYVIFDVKTSRWRSVHDASYMFDEQCIPYAFPIQHAIDPQINSFKVNYMWVYVDLRKPDIKYFEFDKSLEDIRDWARKTLLMINQIKMYTEMGWFPRRGSACYSYNKVCPYFDECGSRDQIFIQRAISLMQDEYYERKFEPWIELDLELAA